MSNQIPTISPANLSKIEEKFKKGVQRIAEIQNNKAVNCFKQNPNSISGFVDCFRAFHEKNIELGSLIEQRMNWSLIQYANCINGKLLSLELIYFRGTNRIRMPQANFRECR